MYVQYSSSLMLSHSCQLNALKSVNSKMDHSTAAAVLRIQLQDIEELLQNEILQHQDSKPSDLQLALETYQRDLRVRESSLHDRRIASSFAAAVDLDSEEIDLARREEAVCFTDHSLAWRLSGRNPPTPQPQLSTARPEGEPISQKLASFNRVGTLAPDVVFPVPNGVHEEASLVLQQSLEVTSAEKVGQENISGSPKDFMPLGDVLEEETLKRKRSASPVTAIDPARQCTVSDHATCYEQLDSNLPAAKRPKKSSPEPEAENSTKVEPVRVCVACREASQELVGIPCGHLYCIVCLAAYVEASLTPTDSEFPPTCCKVPIAPGIIKNSVSPDLSKRYTERQSQEFARCALYCAEQGCAVTIGQASIADNKGHCAACNRDTCNLCRLAWHGIDKCPTNEEREKIMALSKSEGWQTCYKCRNMVELNIGCYHIR